MAKDTKTPDPEYNIWEDMVPFIIPKDRNTKEDVSVSVNGRSFIIKRGVPVDLPRPVFEVLRNREDALAVRDAYDEANASV